MATPRAGSVVNNPAGLKPDDGGFGVGFFISFRWLVIHAPALRFSAGLPAGIKSSERSDLKTRHSVFTYKSNRSITIIGIQITFGSAFGDGATPTRVQTPQKPREPICLRWVFGNGATNYHGASITVNLGACVDD